MMTRGALLVLLLVFVGIESAGQEKADLVTPVPKTVTSYEVAGVYIHRLPDWELGIEYLDDQGGRHRDAHRGADAEALVKALNKADLSVKSLERRVLEHLIAEGKIPPATITGTPR